MVNNMVDYTGLVNMVITSQDGVLRLDVSKINSNVSDRNFLDCFNGAYSTLLRHNDGKVKSKIRYNNYGKNKIIDSEDNITAIIKLSKGWSFRVIKDNAPKNYVIPAA